MVDLKSLQPEDVINPEHWQYYKDGIDFFYMELVHLNVNLFILDHVSTFPFGLFTRPGRSIFFRKVYENFFYSSLLMITRLATDKGRDTITLPRFKNKLTRIVKEDYVDALKAELRSNRFDEETRILFEKAQNLRTQRLVHAQEEVVFKLTKEEIVTFGELKSLYSVLERLFHALEFGHGHMMLPIDYSPDVQHPPGVDSRADIEELLDLIARESDLLNLPEINPEHWKIMRDQLSNEEVQLLNEYRRKFNLPAV